MWSGAILAGGRATRFGGRDKSALVVQSQSILERQVNVLAELTDDILIVGVDGPRDAPHPVRSIVDRVPGCGPLGGLHAALACARGDATIVVACDMPFLAAPFLEHLLGLTREADAVVPRTGRGYHPLCAAYTRACLAPAEARLTEGRLKMIDLFEDVRVRVVTAEEIAAFGDSDRLLANVNTPADYVGLEALHGHQL
jgi:molybdopterin-guanine dinucleotide biosynthesis protein A